MEPKSPGEPLSIGDALSSNPYISRTRDRQEGCRTEKGCWSSGSADLRSRSQFVANLSLSKLSLLRSCNGFPNDIFLLAGQSNMAGRGGVKGNMWDGNVPPQCRPNPSVLRLNAGLHWEEASEPLHVDIDVTTTCGVGPGMSFANRVRANSSRNRVVGLVPCAVGGTRLSQWERGASLYSELVGRAKESLKEGGTIRALLWYQGESDTVNSHDADSYKVKMEKFIADLRSDLSSPSLPVIQVVLASGEGPFVEKVRNAQRKINLPNVAYVNAKGLPLNEDHLHLTTGSQVRLGEMMAHSYIQNFSGVRIRFVG